MRIKIKKLKPNAVLPNYHTKHAAGMDLCATFDEPIVLKQMEWMVVPTGLAVALPEGYEMQIRGRSGLAAKYGIGLVNGVGTIDADYRGEIGVILINYGKEDFVINPGDRIAQAIVTKFEKVEWLEVEDLGATSRGSGGFGSTGKN